MSGNCLPQRLVSAAPGTKIETMTEKRQLRNLKTLQRFQTSVGNFC
jgi:hypothetical protein